MSLINFRERLGARMKDEESGFSLVELLVVMLILGLLAAIAIPAFFNQRDKARDADAKSHARTAQTAVETFATDNGGTYDGVEVVDLTTIEATLNDATNLTAQSTDGGDGYVVSAESSTGNVFTITRSAAGTTSLTCTVGGDAGCPTGGNWGGGDGGGGEEPPG